MKKVMAFVPAYVREEGDPALPDNTLPGDPAYPSTGPIYGGGHPSAGFPIGPEHPGGGPVFPPGLHPGGGPVYPPGHPSAGFPIGGGPGHPSTGPIYGGGHPSTGPIYGGGHPENGLPATPAHPSVPIVLPPTGGKPKGFPIASMQPGWTAPTTAPAPGGVWVTVDAGKGEPPAWGYFPPSADNGGVAEPKGGVDVSPTLPPGHYVPVATGGEHPSWVFVPEIGSDYGVIVAPPAPK